MLFLRGGGGGGDAGGVCWVAVGGLSGYGKGGFSREERARMLGCVGWGFNVEDGSEAGKTGIGCAVHDGSGNPVRSAKVVVWKGLGGKDGWLLAASSGGFGGGNGSG